LNKDKDSTYFDLKFTLAVSDIDFSTLTEKQMVNHFKSSRCLTTKVGLLHTLRNCPFFANHHYDVNDFFPRSYDFSFPIDLQNFLDDYYCLEAKAILKRLLHRWQRNKTIKINVGVLKTLINVIRKCSYKVDDSFLDSSGLIEEQCFSSLQSIIIQHGDEWLHREVYDTDLNEDSCQAKTIKSLLVDRKKIEDVKATAKKRTKLLKLLCQLHLMDENYMDLIKVTLEKHCDTSSLQSTINGANSNNIWILKPAGKSRGRGISVEKSLHGILKHIAAASDSRNKLNQWVVQKYIENPMTIAKRKFDIRQWVMVTGKHSM
jgi:tubulin monoglycylase TTLL3/8